jgi:NTE family protein
VHLVDGGVIDNLGLSSLNLMHANAETPYAPFSAESAARLRQFSMLVVNAVNLRAVDWQRRAQGPTGAQLLDTAYDVTVEAANRAHYDAFAAAAAQWQDDLIAWRCALSPEEGARLSGNQDSWECAALNIEIDMVWFNDLDQAGQARLGAIPTRVSLPSDDIDALIEGGRAALNRSMGASTEPGAESGGAD